MASRAMSAAVRAGHSGGGALFGMKVVKSVAGWPMRKRAAMGSQSASGGRPVSISTVVQPTLLHGRSVARVMAARGPDVRLAAVALPVDDLGTHPVRRAVHRLEPRHRVDRLRLSAAQCVPASATCSRRDAPKSASLMLPLASARMLAPGGVRRRWPARARAFDVAVDDPVLVQVLQPLKNLLGRA